MSDFWCSKQWSLLLLLLLSILYLDILTIKYKIIMKENDRGTTMGIANSATSFGMRTELYIFTNFMSYTEINQVRITKAG